MLCAYFTFHTKHLLLLKNVHFLHRIHREKTTQFSYFDKELNNSQPNYYFMFLYLTKKPTKNIQTQKMIISHHSKIFKAFFFSKCQNCSEYCEDACGRIINSVKLNCHVSVSRPTHFDGIEWSSTLSRSMLQYWLDLFPCVTCKLHTKPWYFHTKNTSSHDHISFCHTNVSHLYIYFFTKEYSYADEQLLRNITYLSTDQCCTAS